MGTNDSLVIICKQSLLKLSVICHFQLKEVQESELQARDQVVLVAEEKNRRIALLEQQVDCIEANQAELNSTVTALEDLEEELRKKISEMDTKSGKEGGHSRIIVL